MLVATGAIAVASSGTRKRPMGSVICLEERKGAVD